MKVKSHWLLSASHRPSTRRGRSSETETCHQYCHSTSIDAHYKP